MYESYFEKLRTEGKLRNLKESSIRNYSESLDRFLRWVEKPPEELTCEDVRNYILFKQSQGVSATTINMYNSGIRFFYKHVLQILWDDESVDSLRGNPLDHLYCLRRISNFYHLASASVGAEAIFSKYMFPKLN